MKIKGVERVKSDSGVIVESHSQVVTHSLFFFHHICRTDSTQSDSARQGFVFPPQPVYLLEGVSRTIDALVSIAAALSTLTKRLC